MIANSEPYECRSGSRGIPSTVEKKIVLADLILQSYTLVQKMLSSFHEKLKNNIYIDFPQYF